MVRWRATACQAWYNASPNKSSNGFGKVTRWAAAGLMAVAALMLPGLALAQAWPQGTGPSLPADVDAALTRAKLPRDAISILVQEVQAKTPARLNHRTAVPVNPASVMKLVTTYAALDLLGPAFTWSTPVYVDGPVRDGVLQGNLIIKGQGDPKLVMERLWLLLRRVQGLGIRTITGDILLDRSAFDLPEVDPASFDGEPLRPYNAAPDALLMNFKSVILTFQPDRAAGVALVYAEPPLAGVQMPRSVPLQAGECADYRADLKADFSDPSRIRLLGGYPASCGEKVWPVAYVEPRSYAARLVEGLWKDLGGQLGGRVRDGKVPAGLRPVFEQASPALADVVRDINKYSNNVMAQQVFLTLGLQLSRRGDAAAVAGFDASRELVKSWWKERWPDADQPLLDNGSGLSRNERITAQALGQMLLTAYQSPVMSELLSSLPVAGVDGTLRRSKFRSTQGAAHLKTGSLRDVAAIAGYVLAASGKRYVVVAVVNHPTLAGAARPVFDTLLDWTMNDR